MENKNRENDAPPKLELIANVVMCVVDTAENKEGRIQVFF